MIEQVAHGLYFSRGLLLVAAASLVVAVPSLFGQTNVVQGSKDAQDGAAARIPQFAVASVKPNTLNDGWRLQFTQNGLSALGVTMRMLVKEAYGIGEDNRISGTQNWLDSERFDIEAKVDDTDFAEFQTLNYDQRLPMLQVLLADRFKLAIHREDREQPIYALTPAKTRARLQESKSDCTDRPPTFTRSRPGQMAVECFTMPALARYLSLTPSVGRHVVDKTGLTGRYDFELGWTPDTSASPIVNASNGSPIPADSSGPSIFTALQEQLGLKLESQKGPVQVLVIDHVEQPSEN